MRSIIGPCQSENSDVISYERNTIKTLSSFKHFSNLENTIKIQVFSRISSNCKNPDSSTRAKEGNWDSSHFGTEL